MTQILPPTYYHSPLSFSLISISRVLQIPNFHFQFLLKFSTILHFLGFNSSIWNSISLFRRRSTSMSSETSPSPSYWCYRCNRFIIVQSTSLSCPDCNTGFIEAINSPTAESRRNHISSSPRIRRTPTDRSPFNPVIVLRAPSEGDGGDRGGYDLYYDDGAGSGLRPLPASVSEFLLGSGFDRLLDQLAQIEINGIGRVEQPPASKAAIESMPIVRIDEDHVETESHCAVCKEAFEFGSEAKEMPCKHIYHPDCILPWLSLRNSCPVCRHELPSDNPEANGGVGVGLGQQLVENSTNEEEAVGLTIWRLPGGGFAVGRFSGGRRGGERELPVVYTEMDGGFNQGGVPRRISWGSRGGRGRESGRIRRAFRQLFSCFRGNHQSAEETSSSSDSRVNQRNQSPSLFGSSSRSRSRGLGMSGRIRRL